jgi:hypothetical protein
MLCSGCAYLDRQSSSRGAWRAVPVGSHRRPTRTGQSGRRESRIPWVYMAEPAAGKGCWGSERLGQIFERRNHEEC